MITLQDAIERARLGADDDGLLGSYLYDQIVQQLAQEDKYAFTMALVDLGIHTKLGTHQTYQAMRKILADDYDPRDLDKEDEEDEDEALVDSFVKAAQAFRRQTPSGLWVPDSYEPGDETPQRPEPEKPVKSVEPESVVEEVYSGESGYETSYEYEEPDWSSMIDVEVEGPEEAKEPLKESPKDEPEAGPEFVEVSTDDLVETLEGAGILIDKDGNVRLYKQNIPGLYTKDIKSWVPQPLEATLNRLNSEANAIDREQERIADLQDVITLVGQDVEAIDQGGKLKDFTKKFQENYNKLEKFKYSPKSTNPEIASIAEDLQALRGYLAPSKSNVKMVKNDAIKVRNLVSGLKGKLDRYYQTQYEKYDSKIETIDALERVQEIKERSPEEYQRIVDELGGITASMFITAWDPDDWDEYGDHGDEPQSPYGSLEVDVGKDYLKSVLGPEVFEVFMERGGLNSQDFDDLRNSLESIFELEYPEDEEEGGVTFNLIEGKDLKAIRGIWVVEPEERSTGFPGGAFLDDAEELMQYELSKVRDALEEDLQIFRNEYEKGELV